MVTPAWEPSPEGSRFARRKGATEKDPLDEFYSVAERRESAETDLGDKWRSNVDKDATFAVRWIENTGEVYALRLVEPLDGRIRIWLLWVTGAFVPNFRKDEHPAVTVLGVCPSKSELFERISGWEDAMPTGGSLEWLKGCL